MPRALTVLLLVLAALLGGVLAYRSFGQPLGGTPVTSGPRVPVERLVGDDGKPRDLNDWAGRTRLVFFGYTRCPDVCPITMGVLSRAYAELSPEQRARLKVLLVTVDPAHDTPKQLRTYLDHFHADFTGLTGQQAALERTKKGFFVFAHTTEEHLIMHGDTVAVVDGEGRMRRVYNQQAVTDGSLARDLPRLADGAY